MKYSSNKIMGPFLKFTAVFSNGFMRPDEGSPVHWSEGVHVREAKLSRRNRGPVRHFNPVHLTPTMHADREHAWAAATIIITVMSSARASGRSKRSARNEPWPCVSVEGSTKNVVEMLRPWSARN